MNITIKYDCENIDWNLVFSTLKRVGMNSPDAETCRKAFENSYTTVFAFDGETMVGFARAISDGVRQAAIYDVALIPEYQGKGIGRILIDSIMKKLPGCNAILYARPGKEPFYEKMGFRLMKTGMAIFLNPDQMREKGFTE